MDTDLKNITYDNDYVNQKNNSVMEYVNRKNTVSIFVKPINGRIVKVLIRDGQKEQKSFSKILINKKLSWPKVKSVFLNKSNGTITTPDGSKYQCEDFFTYYLPVIQFYNPRYFYIKERTRILKNLLPHLIYYIKYYYDYISTADIYAAEPFIISDLAKNFDALPNIPKKAKFQLQYHDIAYSVGYVFTSALDIQISKKEYSDANLNAESLAPNCPKLVFELVFFMSYLRKFC